MEEAEDTEPVAQGMIYLNDLFKAKKGQFEDYYNITEPDNMMIYLL